MTKRVLKTARRESTVPRRERFFLLLLFSLLIHGTLTLLLTIGLSSKRFTTPEPDRLEEPPPEVTLEISPPDRSRSFITAKESTDTAHKNAPFESNEDTKAASELPPDGSLPLPTQQGKSQDALELQNQQHTKGDKPSSTAGTPLPPAPPTQQPSPGKPFQQSPSSSPAPTSTPLNTPSPETSPPPQTTPPPRNSVRLLEPTKPEASSAKESPESSRSLPTQPSTPGNTGSRKGYQPETRQTVIRGNISNRGRSSGAAEATPIGRYKKAMADAIGSRWYYYVNERMGLLSIGTVSLSFKITASGKITGLHLVSANSNESLTDCSMRSIMDAKLPAIPPDVAQTLQDGSLEIDYSFTIY